MLSAGTVKFKHEIGAYHYFMGKCSNTRNQNKYPCLYFFSRIGNACQYLKSYFIVGLYVYIKLNLRLHNSNKFGVGPTLTYESYLRNKQAELDSILYIGNETKNINRLYSYIKKKKNNSDYESF